MKTAQAFSCQKMSAFFRCYCGLKSQEGLSRFLSWDFFCLTFLCVSLEISEKFLLSRNFQLCSQIFWKVNCGSNSSWPCQTHQEFPVWLHLTWQDFPLVCKFWMQRKKVVSGVKHKCARCIQHATSYPQLLWDAFYAFSSNSLSRNRRNHNSIAKLFISVSIPVKGSWVDLRLRKASLCLRP